MTIASDEPQSHAGTMPTTAGTQAGAVRCGGGGSTGGPEVHGDALVIRPGPSFG